MAGVDGCRVHYEQPGAATVLATKLATVVRQLGVPHRRLVYVCIGTDRSTGDALGPLIGDRLQPELGVTASVVGTLAEPVHAANLHEVVGRLRLWEPDAVIVAVDACLGRLENVGTITVGYGALAPGAGVNKSLPEVGAAHVTGTVNVGGFMEYFVLQNTRLHLVLGMAGIIARGLTDAAHLAASLTDRQRTAEEEVAPALG